MCTCTLMVTSMCICMYFFMHCCSIMQLLLHPSATDPLQARGGCSCKSHAFCNSTPPLAAKDSCLDVGGPRSRPPLPG